MKQVPQREICTQASSDKSGERVAIREYVVIEDLRSNGGVTG